MACARGGCEDSDSDTENDTASADCDENCKRKTKTLFKKKSDKSESSGIMKENSCNPKKSKSNFWSGRLRKKFPSRSKKKDNSNDASTSHCACNDLRQNDSHLFGSRIIFNPALNTMGACRSGAEGPSSYCPSNSLGTNESNHDVIIPSISLRDADPVLFHSSVGVHFSRFLFQSLSNPLIISNNGSNLLNSEDETSLPTQDPRVELGLNYQNSFSPSHSFERSSLHDHFPTITAEQLLRLSEAITGQCVLSSAAYRQEENSSGESTPPAVHSLISLGSQSQSHLGCGPHTVHTQVDYIHCLVPDLTNITNCSFYWGVMDRYEAERLLENKPEGTFLLRDSAQEEFLFSVSFRRYGRSLHARVEQWNHKFSFDSHDPGVFASDTVTGLMEHYKDPSCCMFFEPMLTLPLHRSYTFSLQHLGRAMICTHSTYDGISTLPLPKTLLKYLKYYHYKQKVRVRMFECTD